jgi:hypothetical protein
MRQDESARMRAKATTAVNSLNQAAERLDNAVKALLEIGVPPEGWKPVSLMASNCRDLADALKSDVDGLPTR